MKTITDSLKKFYAKLGGDVSKLPSRTTSADLIDAMSDVYTDSELPAVTSADAGKILTVDSEGNWVAVNPQQ